MKEQIRKSITSEIQLLQTYAKLMVEGHEEDPMMYKLITGGGIAISIVVLQAFLGIGVSDRLTLYSVICFAIALPMLATYLLFFSIMKAPKYTQSPRILILPFIAGIISCGAGIYFALAHLSSIAGGVFLGSIIVSLLISLYLLQSSKQYGIDD